MLHIPQLIIMSPKDGNNAIKLILAGSIAILIFVIYGTYIGIFVPTTLIFAMVSTIGFIGLVTFMSGIINYLTYLDTRPRKYIRNHNQLQTLSCPICENKGNIQLESMEKKTE